MRCLNAPVKPDKYNLLMHWEYFVKNKGKAERYKKENKAKISQIRLNIKKLEGADGGLCPCIIIQTRYVKCRECR